MYDKQNPPVSTSLDLFNEDVYAAMDPAGRIVRRDHFKGFTPAQQRRLRQENEIILQQKKLRDMEEKQAEMIWTKQQVRHFFCCVVIPMQCMHSSYSFNTH